MKLLRIKLAQLTNKCSDPDLDYYVKECGNILGITGMVDHGGDPKDVLHYVMMELVKFKSSQFS